MKRSLLKILPVFLLLLPFAALSQQQIGCIEPGLRLQAEEMKQQFIAQGFVVRRDAMLNMSGNEVFPVVADLRQGVFYQIIFVGNTRARRLSMDIRTEAGRRVIRKTAETGKQDPNYISFSFTPEKSDTYLFSLRQHLRQKSCCGSLTIMALPAADEQPQNP